MFHQRKKNQLLAISTLGLSILLTFIVLFTFQVWLLFLASYLLVCSMITDAVYLRLSFQIGQSVIQFIRGATLFCLITMLLLYVLRL